MVRRDIFSKIIRLIEKGFSLREALDILNIGYSTFVSHASPEQKEVLVKLDNPIIDGATQHRVPFTEVMEFLKSNPHINSVRGYIRAYKNGQLPKGFPRKIDSYDEYESSHLFADNRQAHKIAKSIVWCSVQEFNSFVRTNNIKSVRALRTLHDLGKLPLNIPYKHSTVKKLYGNISW